MILIEQKSNQFKRLVKNTEIKKNGQVLFIIQ